MKNKHMAIIHSRIFAFSLYYMYCTVLEIEPFLYEEAVDRTLDALLDTCKFAIEVTRDPFGGAEVFPLADIYEIDVWIITKVSL